MSGSAVGTSPARLLVVNQAGAGSLVMGHAQVSGVLRRSMSEAGFECDVQDLPAMSCAEWLATLPIPRSWRLDGGLQTTRWLTTTALAARRFVNRHLSRTGDPDVLLLHSHVIALRMADLMRRVPTVLSVDATVRDWYDLAVWRRATPWPTTLLGPSLRDERKAFAGAAIVLAWTQWARRGVLAAQPRANVVVHHPGLDIELFRPGPRDPSGPVRALFVGGRFAEKGGDDLLAAAAPLLTDNLLRLDVVTPDATPTGPGVHVHRLRANSAELAACYQQADVLVLPSHADATPWVVLEALACGTPVIASAVGGIPDMLPGNGSELITPGDIGGLRQALQRVVDRGRSDTAARSASRAHVLEHYDSRRQAARLTSLLARAT